MLTPYYGDRREVYHTSFLRTADAIGSLGVAAIPLLARG
jgi:hypothetical protein